MQGACAAVVAGVECREQLPHLSTTHLADDEAIRSHPQRLPNQSREVDAASALEVRLPGLERDDVWVPDAQLRHLLDGHDALSRAGLAEQSPEQRGLATPARPRDEHVDPALDQAQNCNDAHRCERLRAVEVGDRRRLGPGQPEGDGSARPRHRRQHGMHPDAAGKPRIAARVRLVDVPASRSHQSDGEVARFGLLHPYHGRHGARPAIYDDRPWPVHEHVGDPRVGDRGASGPKSATRARLRRRASVTTRS